VVLYRPELAYWDAADAVVMEPLLVDQTPAEEPPGKVIVLAADVHNEDTDDLPDVYTIPLPSAVSQEQPAHQDDPGTAAMDNHPELAHPDAANGVEPSLVDQTLQEEPAHHDDPGTAAMDTADDTQLPRLTAEDVDSVITSTNDNTDSTSHGDPAPEDDLGTTTKPTAPMATAGQAKEYRKAIPGHKVKLYSPIQMKDILSLKASGDRIDKWESVLDTQISDPQPNEVYFRDFRHPPGPTRKSPFDLLNKESKDGYKWMRVFGDVQPEDWSIILFSYHNLDRCTKQPNPRWSKQMIMFTKEEKMIILYSGTLKSVR
jgi:hypothetical protein